MPRAARYVSLRPRAGGRARRDGGGGGLWVTCCCEPMAVRESKDTFGEEPDRWKWGADCLEEPPKPLGECGIGSVGHRFLLSRREKFSSKKTPA